MLITGVWRLTDDGVLRPIIRGEVRKADGTWIRADFLTDSGADRTVFSADILLALGLPPVPTTETLAGVGGGVGSVVVETQIQLVRETGAEVLFRGQFAAFTQPEALDLCVLGRDILNLFALVIDRQQDLVCLVGYGHRCLIVAG